MGTKTLTGPCFFKGWVGRLHQHKHSRLYRILDSACEGLFFRAWGHLRLDSREIEQRTRGQRYPTLGSSENQLQLDERRFSWPLAPGEFQVGLPLPRKFVSTP